MTTTAIRKKLISFIADADDKKVKGLYMLVEDELSTNKKFKLTNSHLKIMDQERAKHIGGRSKSYSREEAKQIVRGKRKL